MTKAAFVEVWRLAPVSGGRHDDAIEWLTAESDCGMTRAADGRGFKDGSPAR